MKKTNSAWNGVIKQMSYNKVRFADKVIWMISIGLQSKY